MSCCKNNVAFIVLCFSFLPNLQLSLHGAAWVTRICHCCFLPSPNGNLKLLEEELHQISPVGFSLLLTYKDYVDDMFFHRFAHFLWLYPSSSTVILFHGPKTDKNPWGNVSFSLPFILLFVCLHTVCSKVWNLFWFINLPNEIKCLHPVQCQLMIGHL